MSKSNINLKKVPISDKIKGEMSLTVADQQFIKRVLDLQCDTWNDAFDKNIVELTKALAEIVNTQNERLFEAMEKQNAKLQQIADDITEIKRDIISIKDRLELIENKVETEEKRITELERRMQTKRERMDGIERRVENIENRIGIIEHK